MSASDPVDRVCEALAEGSLSIEDLTTRKLGKFLGKTTSVLYHHWGSLDGLLFAVSQRGFTKLRDALEARRTDGVQALARTFVEFGLDHPSLYGLMFERRYDWKALREAGAFDGSLPGMQLLAELTAGLRESGSAAPDVDARLLIAGLHGLVSLAQSGRANVGALTETDRDIARAAAGELAHRLCCPEPKETP